MRPKQQNKFVRFILRAIDVCVGLYMPRPVRWKEEPFRKATDFEWRLGWFVVASAPIIMLIPCSESVRTIIDSAEHHSVVWLYVGFIGGGLLYFLCLFKIGPKVPLYFSIPVAIVGLIYCIWLLGFHSEKVFHSNSNW
jgi:hypothetical protein